MASRYIIALVNYKDDMPANPPANPPAHPLANPPADPLIDPLLMTSLTTLDSTITTEPIPTTVASNILDDSNIYDDLENYSPAPVMPATSIQPSESTSQVPLRVPRLQAKSQPRSWVYDHFITTLLDDYYISKQTRKQTQDR